MLFPMLPLHLKQHKATTHTPETFLATGRYKLVYQVCLSVYVARKRQLKIVIEKARYEISGKTRRKCRSGTTNRSLTPIHMYSTEGKTCSKIRPQICHYATNRYQKENDIFEAKSAVFFLNVSGRIVVVNLHKLSGKRRPAVCYVNIGHSGLRDLKKPYP